MVRDEIRERFGYPDEKLHVIRNAVDGAAFHPGLRADREPRARSATGIPTDATVFLLVGSGFERKGVATAIRALARAAGARRTSSSSAATSTSQRYARLARRSALAGRVHDRRAADRSAPVLRRRPTRSCCRRSTTRARTRRSRRWRAGCRSSPAPSPASAELVTEHDAGFVCDSRDVAGARRAHARAARPATRARAWASNARDAVRAAHARGDDARSSCSVQRAARGERRRMRRSRARRSPTADAARPRRPRASDARAAGAILRVRRAAALIARARGARPLSPPRTFPMTGPHPLPPPPPLRPPVLVGVRARGARDGRRSPPATC